MSDSGKTVRPGTARHGPVTTALLTEAGIGRRDVHTVVLTHRHEDHTG
ncbi:MBL fold metallo-hydrolase [Streptomyces sp. NPDC058659]